MYVDHSDIREGSLDELKAGVQRLVDFIDAHEPQLITYGFYIDEEAAKMTVVAVHPDSASLELHMDIGSAEFRKLGAPAYADRDRMLRPAEREGPRADAAQSGHAGRRRDRGFHRTIRGVHAPHLRNDLSACGQTRPTAEPCRRQFGGGAPIGW